jgi:hypothetical protein
MEKLKRNKVRMAGLIAIVCLSLACFTYINSLSFPGNPSVPENVYAEELTPENPEVLPDVELIKRLVRKAFEFMSRAAF